MKCTRVTRYTSQTRKNRREKNEREISEKRGRGLLIPSLQYPSSMSHPAKHVRSSSRLSAVFLRCFAIMLDHLNLSIILYPLHSKPSFTPGVIQGYCTHTHARRAHVNPVHFSSRPLPSLSLCCYPFQPCLLIFLLRYSLAGSSLLSQNTAS